MSEQAAALPVIGLRGYLDPNSPEEKLHVIEQVRDAAQRYGFFQVIGHGISVSLQRDLLRCMCNFFDLSEDDKLKLSFLENPCRRGYEKSGMSWRPGDTLPDAKLRGTQYASSVRQPPRVPSYSLLISYGSHLSASSSAVKTQSSSFQISTDPMSGRTCLSLISEALSGPTISRLVSWAK